MAVEQMSVHQKLLHFGRICCTRELCGFCLGLWDLRLADVDTRSDAVFSLPIIGNVINLCRFNLAPVQIKTIWRVPSAEQLGTLVRQNMCDEDGGTISVETVTIDFESLPNIFFMRLLMCTMPTSQYE